MRRLLASLILAALFTLGLPPAQAQEPCNPAGGSCVVDDLQSAADTSGSASQQYSLPAGALSAEDLERAFQEVIGRGEGVMGFFALLADGQGRSLDGDVVRALFARYGVQLDFLPLDALERVEAADGAVLFHFDFGQQGYRDIELPGSTQKVLDARHRSDPWLVDRRNRVREERSDARKLRVQDELRFSLDEGGLAGLREGDLAVRHWLAGWVNLNVHSERHAGRIATGEKDRPVLQTDSRGEPVVQDGHYVPQCYDDWVIITAAGRRIEVGVPPLRGRE